MPFKFEVTQVVFISQNIKMSTSAVRALEVQAVRFALVHNSYGQRRQPPLSPLHSGHTRHGSRAPGGLGKVEETQRMVCELIRSNNAPGESDGV